jgi:hypothetical protein
LKLNKREEVANWDVIERALYSIFVYIAAFLSFKYKQILENFLLKSNILGKKVFL